MATLKVLIRGSLNTQTGYGNDAIGLARALLQMGVDVHVSPVSVSPPIPPEIAALLVKDFEPPYDLAVVHVDPGALEVPSTIRRNAHRVVGWTMWEYTEYKVPKADFDRVRTRMEDLDVLLSYDPTSYEAMETVKPVGLRHHVVQGGYDPSLWPLSQNRDWDSLPTRFCMVGQLHERKDPFCAVEAFKLVLQEVPGEVELHLKTTVKTLHPKMQEVYPGLRIHWATWSHQQLYEFYEKCHAYLAPSRGEGKNLPPIEALSTGMPVIGTFVGGHQSWLGEDWSYIVRHSEVDSLNGKMAQADPEHLAELMLRVHRERQEARRKGEIGARTLPSMMAWPTKAERMLQLALQTDGRGVKVA